ncbi:hypothetical protein KBB17_02030 [Candidatus Saccharibacteria bacterium]|jgi:ATP citrate (pro-S)-lyase|nr:hypothetical protein [Candidatus Saccharibacteria bacterium]MBP9132210.1 hypothetical protein [Candidatus Saccharibacteria bacterium]
MARVKLSEFRAKSILINDYQGVSLRLDSLSDDINNLDADKKYIIKVDQGIKKRGKQGLIRLNVTKTEAETAVNELAERGFAQFIAEEMLPHEDSEEHYLSIERTREGMQVSYSPDGGVDVEDNPESMQQFIYAQEENKTPIADDLLAGIIDHMDKEHLSLVEINPIVIQDQKVTLLDAAVLADSAGEYFAKNWSGDDVVDARKKTPEEISVAKQNDNTPSALSLRVLNPDGAIWLVLNGGGASITIADEASNHGKGKLVGNYGEFSGGPTPEESYLYVREVLSLMLKSKAPKKALVVAGTVANFTDVLKTFAGTMQAIGDIAEEMHQQNIKVFVRRGGPNEKEGLAKMEKFLKEQDLFGSIAGSEGVITEAINYGLEYIEEGDK